MRSSSSQWCPLAWCNCRHRSPSSPAWVRQADDQIITHLADGSQGSCSVPAAWPIHHSVRAARCPTGTDQLRAESRVLRWPHAALQINCEAVKAFGTIGIRYIRRRRGVKGRPHDVARQNVGTFLPKARQENCVAVTGVGELVQDLSQYLKIRSHRRSNLIVKTTSYGPACPVTSRGVFMPGSL